jgi:hypothetical protein
MPGTADASQYTQFKKANAIQKGTQTRDRLTQYVPKLSVAFNSTRFLSSLTNKVTRPLVPTPINTDFPTKKLRPSNQNCS